MTPNLEGVHAPLDGWERFAMKSVLKEDMGKIVKTNASARMKAFATIFLVLALVTEDGRELYVILLVQRENMGQIVQIHVSVKMMETATQ